MKLGYADYARTYAGMADGELLKLSTELHSLPDVASEALLSELDRRKLRPEAPRQPEETRGTEGLYRSHCHREVTDPLVGRSCSASACRSCGTRLDVTWEVDDDSGIFSLGDPLDVQRQAAG